MEKVIYVPVLFKDEQPEDKNKKYKGRIEGINAGTWYTLFYWPRTQQWMFDMDGIYEPAERHLAASWRKPTLQQGGEG